MRLNLNDSIRVKLTDLGKDIYYHRYDRLNNALGRQICKPSMPKVDEDGYTTFQLWCFMELYGVHMAMALPNVIEPLDIVFDAQTIEPATEQPEPHYDEWCTDCKEYDQERHSCPRWNKVIRETLKDVQPEIIRCKDCKHSEPFYRDKSRCFLWHEEGIDVFDDGFCNYAERRTD